jgi:diguanylate cyclase (GGDEF)-like protein
MAPKTNDAVAPIATKALVPDAARTGSHSIDRPWSLDDLPVAVLVLQGDTVVAVNERWTALTGLDLTASLGDGWLSAARRADRAALSALPAQALGGDDAVSELRLAGPGGRGVMWVQARVHHVDGSTPSSCVITIAETEAHDTNQTKLLHLATHDGLTGLLNRAAFIAEVEDALERDAPATMLSAVLFVDLDRFKAVNDRLGHQAGDTLLAVACRRIVSSLRSTETAGRLGGDEVGVLCTALPSRDSAVRLAERIVATLEEPFTIHDEVVLIGASVGVAFSDGGSLTAATLVNDADRAMYRAKAEGRARAVVFTSADEPTRCDAAPAELETSLAHVAVSVARGERKVNDLWRHSIDLRDDPMAQRLARASQALHTANMALRDDESIG